MATNHRRFQIALALSASLLMTLPAAASDEQESSADPVDTGAVTESAKAAVESKAATNLMTEPPKIPDLPAPVPGEEKLVERLSKRDFETAQKLIKKRLSKKNTRAQKAELLSLLAYTYYRQNKTRSAIKILEHLSDDNTSKEGKRAGVLREKRLADMYVHLPDEQKAIEMYKSALAKANKYDRNDSIRISILEPLTGLLVEKKEFEEAQPYAEELTSLCTARVKAGHIAEVVSLFWAHTHLARIYNETKNTDAKAKFTPQLLALLDPLLTLSAKYQASSLEEDQKAYVRFQNKMRDEFIEDNTPRTLSEYLWLSSQFRMRDLPLTNWTASTGAKPKAAILCVHALGLSNRAFGPLAKELTKRGFTVYAMDVRGFGAWQHEFGSEKVHFERAMDDVKSMLQIIKMREPGKPVFLLGESMGGAIVLRAASDCAGEMSGVISSAPSAKRYGEAKLAALVALHLFRKPTQPFDIGEQLAQQATSQEDLREMWKHDPRAKVSLTPIELIKFNKFMIDTSKLCSSIDNVPIMVVQGQADKLAKPQGTYQMYDSVSSRDKAMLILGDAEHLIFELPNQSKVLLDGVTSWLDNHLAMQASKPIPKPVTLETKTDKQSKARKAARKRLSFDKSP